MDNRPFSSYEIEDRSFVSFVKREIHNSALTAGFSTVRAATVDIAVSELTSNIIKHAGKGELLYRFSKEKDNPLFEIIAIDHGPGIKDISHSMKDGISTTKTLGQGLGALERICNTFQIYSLVKWGTICYCRIYANPYEATDNSELKISALNVSKPGQKVSGDSFTAFRKNNHTMIFHGDGLGHGKDAHEASQLAVANFSELTDTDPVTILRSLNESVKKSRGLVGTVVIADHEVNKWRICGIGNIATRLYMGMVNKNYVSYNGIIGLNIPGSLSNHETQMEKHQTLIMTSDGIKTKWDLHQFPGVLRHDPIMLAAVIYKDCARKTDDMSIIIART